MRAIHPSEKDEKNITAETEAETGVRRSVGSGRRIGLVGAIAIVVVAATSIVLLKGRFSGSQRVGQPVPAPRTVAADPASGSDAAGMVPTHDSLTIAPDALANSGLKVEVVGGQPGSGNGSITSTGVVRPNTYHESPAISLLTGLVREVNVELGQHVEKDQQIALIFSDELGSAQTRYLVALAMLDEHHKHHRRTTELVEVGGASREELEQATTKLRSSELEVAALRQRLVLLGLSTQRINGLRPSTPPNSSLALVAPISGTVISRSINPGEIVQANTVVLRVADLSSVWVVAQVYEKDLASTRVGSVARVTSSAYPDRILTGKITYVDPSLDQATRTAQVRIEMANPGQRLKIGMFVDVAFALNRKSANTVPVVPAIAVQNINNRQVVFVATDTSGVFQIRYVRVGPESNGRVTVLEGLTPGERVVTEGSFLLRAEWVKVHSGS
jgi:membrane fusion protein, heavy metal efflux system